jgi:hypothetical protein
MKMNGAGFKKSGIVRACSMCLVCLALSSRVVAQEQEGQKPAKPPASESAAGSAQGGVPFHEDWTTLTLEKSSLRMERLVLAETDDIPNTGFIRERYQVAWRPKDPFDLYVIRPRGVKKAPVIMYLYSFPEDTEQFKNNLWCETAVAGGYAAVGFVGAVTGHRTRYRLPKDWFVSEMPEALGSTVHDVQLILDYLETRKDLDVNRVAMFGSGSGAAVAIMASAVDARIQVLDLLGAWGDWPRWVAETKIISEEERASYLRAEFLGKVAPLEPVDWIAKVKVKALRMQDVRGNKAMPDDAQEKLEGAAPDFAVINEYGNGRAFLANEAPGDLFQWMKERVKSDGKDRVVVEKSERIHFYPALQTPVENWPNVGTLGTEKTSAGAKGREVKEKDKPKEK